MLLVAAISTASCTNDAYRLDTSDAGSANSGEHVESLDVPCGSAGACERFRPCLNGGALECRQGECFAVSADLELDPNAIDALKACVSGVDGVEIASNPTSCVPAAITGWHTAECRLRTSVPDLHHVGGAWINLSGLTTNATAIIKELKLIEQDASGNVIAATNVTRIGWQNCHYSPWENCETHGPFDLPFTIQVPLGDRKRENFRVVHVYQHGLFPVTPGSVLIASATIDGDVAHQIGTDSKTGQIDASTRGTCSLGDSACEIGISNWECGSGVTFSANAKGKCVAPSAPTPPKPAACTISWETQPNNLKIGDSMTPCFSAGAACGGTFRVDLKHTDGSPIHRADRTIVDAVVTGTRAGCFLFEAYGDIVDQNLVLVASTMNGAPASGMATSRSFAISQQAQTSPPRGNYVVEWTLPSNTTSVPLTSMPSFVEMARAQGPFAAGSVAHFETASLPTTFQLGSNPWAAGYNSGPGDCTIFGRVRIWDPYGNALSVRSVPSTNQDTCWVSW